MSAVCTANPIPLGGHCWHIRWITEGQWPDISTRPEGKVCCWCADYVPVSPEPTTHGRYVPESHVTQQRRLREQWHASRHSECKEQEKP